MARAERNIACLTKDFSNISVDESYLQGLSKEDFISGMNGLSQIFMAMYVGMNKTPSQYAMKNNDDVKGLVKNMNFVFLMAKIGVLNRHLELEIDGRSFASALKESRVTKPEIYFNVFEQLGFIATGLSNKIETSDIIKIEYPDNRFVLPALKAMTKGINEARSNVSSIAQGIYVNQGNEHFEFLDPRVIQKYPSDMSLTIDYLLDNMDDDRRYLLMEVYELLKDHTKIKLEGSNHHNWKGTFSLKANKRVLVTFHYRWDHFDVKLNLANLGDYVEETSSFPKTMIDEMINGGWECGVCNPNCAKPFEFTLGGVHYKKCHCGSFIFSNPDKASSKMLLGLLKRELEIEGSLPPCCAHT